MVILDVTTTYLNHYHNEIDKLRDKLTKEEHKAITYRSTIALVHNTKKIIASKKLSTTDMAYLDSTIDRKFKIREKVQVLDVLALALFGLELTLDIMTSAPKGTYDKNLIFRIRMAHGLIAKISRVEHNNSLLVDNEQVDFSLRIWEQHLKELV